MIKRTVDFTFALAGLIALAPLMMLIGLVIRLDSAGAAIYRSLRVGRGGRTFAMLKFRTMVTDADRNGATSTQADDPRFTRLGPILRRWKIDELPQLINVLRGDMSLVGPRPQVPWAVALYSAEERQLLDVRPGITDYASIHFSDEAEILRGSLDPDRDYLEKIAPEKLRLGLEDVRRHSLGTDLRILGATLCKMAGGNPRRILGADWTRIASNANPDASKSVWTTSR